MKGHMLITLILIAITLALTIIMVALNLYPSWSQYARSLHEPLLFGALTSISSTFLIRSFAHFQRLEERIWGMRQEHIDRMTGFLFIGVLCTPVTHPAWYIETAHLIFTASAIGSAYLGLVTARPHGKLAAWVSFAVGVGGFLGAFIFHLYSIGMGELIAAIPISIYVLATNKSEK